MKRSRANNLVNPALSKGTDLQATCYTNTPLPVLSEDENIETYGK